MAGPAPQGKDVFDLPMASLDLPSPALDVLVAHLWVAPLDVAPPSLGLLVATLSPAERARSDGYRSPDGARRFAAGRGWLRRILAGALGTDPGAVRLTEGAGKPALEDAGGPCFNVSRAGDVILIAVARGEVGVDIEPENAGPAALEASAVWSTPAEAERLRRMAPEDRPLASLRWWTAKEAYLKATGEGLTVPPDEVEVGPAGPDEAPVQRLGDPRPGRWWVRGLRPLPGYVAAVATDGPGWQVRVHMAGGLRAGPVPDPPARHGANA